MKLTLLVSVHAGTPCKGVFSKMVMSAMGNQETNYMAYLVEAVVAKQLALLTAGPWVLF